MPAKHTKYVGKWRLEDGGRQRIHDAMPRIVAAQLFLAGFHVSSRQIWESPKTTKVGTRQES